MNVLIDEHDTVRLTDFGLGVLGSANPNQYGSKRTGNHPFLAPELHDPQKFGRDGNRPTKQSDIYALGCVHFEVCHTHIPGHLSSDTFK